MAKYLKEVLKGVKSSTKVTNDLGGYKPKAGDEEDFAKKHEIEKHADRVGNGDDVYKGTTKHVLANAKEKNHGYKKPEDAKVNEEQIDEAGMPASVIKSKQHRANMTDKQFADSHKDKSDADLRSMAWRHGHGKPGTPGHNHYVNRRNKGLKEEVQIDELSTDLLHRAAHKAAKKAMTDVQGRSGPIFKKRAAQANKFRAKGMEQEKKERAVKEEVIDEASMKQKQHTNRVKTMPGKKGAVMGATSNFEAPFHKVHATISKNGGSKEVVKHEIKAKDKHDAVFNIQMMHHKAGHKVHDTKYKGTVKEETEQVDEVSKTTLGNYIKSASADVGHKKADAAYSRMSGNDKLADRHTDKARKRLAGIYTAANKLSKEEAIDELSKTTLGNYAHAGVRDIASRQYALGKGDKSNTGKLMNRRKGVDKAISKLTKESETPITFPNKQSNNAVGQNV